MSTIGHLRLVAPDELPPLRTDIEAVEDLLDDDDEDLEHSVEKAWHGIHFLLTGTAWEGDLPYSFLVRGGDAVGDNLGYGPARLLDPADVRAVAAALDALTPQALAARYDGERMNELKIYPKGWTQEEAVCRKTLVDHYDQLRRFVIEGAQQGMGLLVYLR